MARTGYAGNWPKYTVVIDAVSFLKICIDGAEIPVIHEALANKLLLALLRKPLNNGTAFKENTQMAKCPVKYAAQVQRCVLYAYSRIYQRY